MSSIYGTGLAFPMSVDASGARVATASDEELVKMSIDQILNTDVHERPFLSKNGVPFGTRLRTVIFESAEVAASIARHEVARALNVWEPRISVVSVDTVVQKDQLTGLTTLYVSVQFSYRSTSREDNLVIPFILKTPSLG